MHFKSAKIQVHFSLQATSVISAKKKSSRQNARINPSHLITASYYEDTTFILGDFNLSDIDWAKHFTIHDGIDDIIYIYIYYIFTR